jgi:MFS family permease
MTLAQPLSSELATVTGRRPAFLVAVAVFIAGTVVCGKADTAFLLLLGRAIQGVGAGATEPVKAWILYDLFPLRTRAKWVSFLNVSWAIGTVAGPLLGGTFADNDNITWVSPCQTSSKHPDHRSLTDLDAQRWVFWINLPPLGLSFAAGALLLGYDKPPPLSWDLVRRVDWGGLVFFTGAGASILFALTGGGSNFPWKSVEAIVPLIIGFVCLLVLGCHETWIAEKPIFRPSVMRCRSTVFQCANVLIHGLLMWMILYYMSLFFLGVKNYSPFETGLWSLPATLTVAPMAIIVGLVVRNTGHYRWFLICGWAVTVITFGLLRLVDENVSNAPLIIISVIGGIGFGALVPGMGVGIQATVDPRDAGHAVCMTLLLRPAGQCLGIAVGQAIFSTRLDHIFNESGFPDGFAQDLMMYARRGLDPDQSGMNPLTAALIPTIIDAIIEALAAVWIAGAVLSGIALLLTLTIRCPPLPDDWLQGIEAQESGSGASIGHRLTAHTAPDDDSAELSPAVADRKGSEPTTIESVEMSSRRSDLPRHSLRQSQDSEAWSGMLQGMLRSLEARGC